MREGMETLRDEFSAHLSDEAKSVIADAAKRAGETGATAVVVQARASATGTAETNKYLAQTRSSIVTDQLVADDDQTGADRSDRLERSDGL
jgi:outer membrane protein OmpA-like peptidoglycan-associated protein